MNKNLVKAINDQINFEFYSAYLYFAMSSFVADEGWMGMANWMRVQAQEEQAHAITLHDFLIERGERSTLTALEGPENTWSSLSQMCLVVLEHEKLVTEKINLISSMAMEHHDHTTYDFLGMFLKEQIEEESTASDLLRRVRRLESAPAAMEMLDKELATRVFVPPFANK